MLVLDAISLFSVSMALLKKYLNSYTPKGVSIYLPFTPLLIVDSWNSNFSAMSFIFKGFIYFVPFLKNSSWAFTISSAILSTVVFLLSIFFISPVAEFSLSFINSFALSSDCEFFNMSL